MLKPGICATQIGGSSPSAGPTQDDGASFGRLAAGVAHEFNSIFQALLGNLELVADETDLPRNSRAQVQAGLELVQKGARLTHSLLSFSTSQLLRPQHVAVDRTLASLRAMLDPILPSNVILSIRRSQGLPSLFVDATQLGTALGNICSNAVDAMPAGGTLDIHVVVSNGTDVQPFRSDMIFVITDEGEGMAPDVLALARQPFFTTRGKAKRSGLGLSMADGFARQSGGSLVIESRPGQGTKVSLSVPAGPEVVSVGERPESADPKILLVEDSPQLLEVYGEMLTDAGYEVVAECDATAAMRRIEAGSHFDLLITDYVLPGANGLELAQLARIVSPGLRTLLITGYASPEQLAALPADVRILSKPFRADQLIRHARETLS